jgi:hypothetical protein
MSTPRASIFDGEDIDVTAFAPKPGPDRSAPAPAAVRAVAEAANFRSREGGSTAPKPAAFAPAPEAAKRQQRRHRTGRNVQFNIKVSQKAVDAFYAITDRQGWVLGETLEHALAALEKALEQDGKAGAQ